MARLVMNLALRVPIAMIPVPGKFRTVKPLMDTLSALTQKPDPPQEVGFAGGLSTASTPRSEIPSFLIATVSWWTPPRTTIVSPGSAALIAFWIDSPGRTACPLGFAGAKPADTSSDKATNTAIVVIKTMRLISATSLHVVRQPVAQLAPHVSYVPTFTETWFQASARVYKETQYQTCVL